MFKKSVFKSFIGGKLEPRHSIFLLSFNLSVRVRTGPGKPGKLAKCQGDSRVVREFGSVILEVREF